jgi:outer membrane protein assembly factor BamB
MASIGRLAELAAEGIGMSRKRSVLQDFSRMGTTQLCLRKAASRWSRYLIAALMPALLAGIACADDWPTYLHNNSRTGATAEGLRTPLKVAWIYSSPSVPQVAWPGAKGREFEGKQVGDRMVFDESYAVAAAGGRAYFGSSVDHQLYCVDVASGKTEWTFPAGASIRLAPTVWNKKVYFGSDDGYAYCVEAANGKLVWKIRPSLEDSWLLGRGEMISRWPVRTGVMVDGGIAFFGAGIFPHEDIYLYAVNADDGSVIWKRDNISEADAGRNELSPQGYLLAGETYLFVPSGRSLPAAIDRKSGAWAFKPTPSHKREGGGVIGGTRALLSHGQLFASGVNHVLAMSEKSGQTGFGWFTGRQMVVSGKWGYLANNERLVKIDLEEYAVASRDRQTMRAPLNELYRSLRLADDTSRAAAQAKFDALKEKMDVTESAGVLWQTRNALGSSLVVTGNLVVAGGNGRVAAFDEQTGEEVWGAAVDGDASNLSVAGGRLFVSTGEGKVYCFAPEAGPQPVAVDAPIDRDPYPRDEWTERYRMAAKEMLSRSGAARGYCLVVGAEEGRLAFELARQSGLKIYGIEPDEAKAAKARAALLSAGLYGHRVVIHDRDAGEIPYSNFFANLIVSDSMLRTGQLPGDPEKVVRHLKPMGGTVCLNDEQGGARDWLERMGLGKDGVIAASGEWITLSRGALPGAGSWTHLYGEPGNTASSQDTRIKGGLGVLWYGDPGIGEMVNRHDGAMGPLAVNGRLFVQGETSVMAYDAYNGQHLWTRDNKGAIRIGVFNNFNPGNLVASDDALFVMIRDRCIELDAATGEVRRDHGLPAIKDPKSHEWGYVAYSDGVLFGTATVRKEILKRLQRRGRATIDTTDGIFAIDVKTGKHLWTYEGGSISHHTVALGPGRVYFVDSTISSEERAVLLSQDKTELKKLEGAEAVEAERAAKSRDVRRVVALDARTGAKVWSQAVDVTDCSEIGVGGGQLTLMYQNDVLVLCGANANGHYWKQFLAGEFARRRLVCISAGDGHQLWAKDANYRNRPIIIENRIFAEPWAFDLYTGAQQLRESPLTGEQEPWSIVRPGHHCGMLVGAPNMLMFRSGYTGFYNLENDEGTRHFAGHRLGCWINAIPANGLVMIPEASAGCVCLFSLASTITLEPREARHPWTIFSSVGATTPVKQIHLNMAAPGDRRDARGTIWLAYPRPRIGPDTGLDLKLDLNGTLLPGGRFESQSELSTPIAATQTPWLYTSAARGLAKFSVPLLGEQDAPATYTVRLHFAEFNETVKPGTRVFDVKLQGRMVLEGIDIAAAAGSRVALVREVAGVAVTHDLAVELVPRAEKPTSEQMPLLSALEVARED